LGTPIIVKPACLGSSVGVSKVNTEIEYKEALKLAFKYDSSLLMEEFVHGRELECAVLGNNNPKASPAGEVELSKDFEFYSFDAKYVDGEATTLHIPADLDEEKINKIKELSLKAYRALGCMDLSRVDLFLKDNGEVIVNEINTLPGFTNISMYPKLCELMGVNYQELISQLIQMAVDRGEHQQKLETEYLSGLS
jgi:D-alanine-D-alanine ligase